MIKYHTNCLTVVHRGRFLCHFVHTNTNTSELVSLHQPLLIIHTCPMMQWRFGSNQGKKTECVCFTFQLGLNTHTHIQREIVTHLTRPLSPLCLRGRRRVGLLSPLTEHSGLGSRQKHHYITVLNSARQLSCWLSQLRRASHIHKHCNWCPLTFFQVSFQTCFQVL